jgi:ferrous-iron efflux pump FieF
MSGAHGHHHHHAQRGSLTSGAAMASVSVATLLVILKGYAAWETGSAAMLGSLADTGLDLIASLVTLLGVRVAAQPSDLDHRFGHGKAEALAALFQVTLIAVAAVGIIIRSIQHLTGQAPPTSAELGIGVSVVAMLVTLALLAYQRMVIRRTGSVAIKADHMHYQSDLLLNIAVIAALALDQYLGFHGADPLFGFAIGLWLAWGAWRSASHAIDQLMDKEWPVEKRQQFLEVAARHPELQGIHDLRTRSSGSHDFVQFHMWVDPDMTVAAAHDVMDEVEAKLMAEFPGVEILIHPDPLGHVDRTDQIAARNAFDVVAQSREG